MKKQKESAPATGPKPVLVTGPLVLDILNYLGNQPISSALPLFQRLVAEVKTQLPVQKA